MSSTNAHYYRALWITALHPSAMEEYSGFSIQTNCTKADSTNWFPSCLVESVNQLLYSLVGRKTHIVFHGNVGALAVESNMGLYRPKIRCVSVALFLVSPQ